MFMSGRPFDRLRNLVFYVFRPMKHRNFIGVLFMRHYTSSKVNDIGPLPGGYHHGLCNWAGHSKNPQDFTALNRKTYVRQANRHPFQS